MRKIALSSLSVSELNQLKVDIDLELGKRSQKNAAVEEIKKLAAEKGLTLEDLLGDVAVAKVKGRRELGPAPVRYRHPQKSNLTWSGRGKRPTWMVEALNAGITIEQLKV